MDLSGNKHPRIDFANLSPDRKLRRLMGGEGILYKDDSYFDKVISISVWRGLNILVSGMDYGSIMLLLQ